MNRLLRFLKDAALGAILAYLGGMLFYCVLLLVLVNALADRSQAQATSFIIGMALMPVIFVAKIAHGQYAIGKTGDGKTKA
jgi:zinc transporter ZupT